MTPYEAADTALASLLKVLQQHAQAGAKDFSFAIEVTKAFKETLREHGNERV